MNARIVPVVDGNQEDQEAAADPLAATYAREIAVRKIALPLMQRDSDALTRVLRYEPDYCVLVEALRLLQNDDFEHIQEAREAALDTLAAFRAEWNADLAGWQRSINKLANKLRELDEVAEQLANFEP